MDTTTDQPPQWRITACTSKACGAATIWTRTESGARSLVDAAPTPDGRWLLVEKEGLDAPFAQYIPPEERAAYPGRLHTTHWATCPKANEYRRPR